MPIKVGGKTIILKDIKSTDLQKSVDQENFDIRPEPPKRTKFKREVLKIKDGNTLIVNGKTKTIGRKSQYLLDMMIIDDEE